MTDPAHYVDVADGFGDSESLTVLVVAGRTRAEVAAALRVDLSVQGDREDWPEDGSVWGLLDVPGGVLATENTGYADPTLDALRELSRGGGAAAVVRNNVQAHLRFGSARDGEILLDADEYMFVEDPSVVPGELRALFDLVWVDLDEDDEADPEEDPFDVALAMVEVVTGIRITAEQAATVAEGDYFVGPSLVYVPE